MDKVERMGRGRQIVRMWEFLNYENNEDGTDGDTVVDILTDLFHFCQSRNIVWTQAVSDAEKWAMKESIEWDAAHPIKEGWEQRLLETIFNHDPLAVNDEEEGCGKWGCKDCYPDEEDE